MTGALRVYTDYLGGWSWAAGAMLALCLIAAGFALLGRRTSKPASVLAVVFAVLSVFVCVAPLSSARHAIFEWLRTGVREPTLYDAGPRAIVGLFGGGVVCSLTTLAALASMGRHAREAARSVAPLVIATLLVPAWLATQLGAELLTDFPEHVLAHGAIDRPRPGFGVLAAVLTTGLGGALVVHRIRAAESALSPLARVLAVGVAIAGMVTFAATRPLAADSAHPLPVGVQLTYLHVPVTDIPRVAWCRAPSDSPILAVSDGSVVLDGRRMTRESLLQELETLRRNWPLLHPRQPIATYHLGIQVPSRDDPRVLGTFLAAVRDQTEYAPTLLVRRVQVRHTASVGDVEQQHLCVLPFELARPNDAGGALPLARVTDGQALARAIASGARRVLP